MSCAEKLEEIIASIAEATLFQQDGQGYIDLEWQKCVKYT
jgi:hypothetical protein